MMLNRLTPSAKGKSFIDHVTGVVSLIYGSGEDIRVYGSCCPHQVTNIPKLALKGTKLTCPKHNWAFDITTGDCIEVGDRPLRRFDSKIEKRRLLAYW